jgi:hypothetical protein
MMMRLLFTLAAPLLLAPARASAQIITQAVGIVAGGQISGTLVGGGGPGMFTNLVIFIVASVRTLIGLFALFLFVRSGLKLINSQEEDKLNKAKKTMASGVVAVMLAYLTPRIVAAFYGLTEGVAFEGGTVLESNVVGGSQILTMEILGIISWVTVLVAPIAVLMIVLSALLAVASFGKDDAVTQMRRAVVGVILGLLLLGSTQAITATFGLATGWPPGVPTVAPLYLRGLFIINALLIYMMWGCAAMTVFSGLMMIFNFGNDDQYGKAKGLLARIAVGLAIVFASWVAVRFVMFLVLG